MVNFKKLQKIIYSFILLFMLTNCNRTPEDLMTEGQWQDSETGLIWMRCSIGQEWKNNSCAGTALKKSFQSTQKLIQDFNNNKSFAEKPNWRLPTIIELHKLRKCDKGWRKKPMPDNAWDMSDEDEMVKVKLDKNNTLTLPSQCLDEKLTLNTEIFPNTPDIIMTPYWSSSAMHAKSNYVIYFYSGSLRSYFHDNEGMIRLVREK